MHPLITDPMVGHQSPDRIRTVEPFEIEGLGVSSARHRLIPSSMRSLQGLVMVIVVVILATPAALPRSSARLGVQTVLSVDRAGNLFGDGSTPSAAHAQHASLSFASSGQPAASQFDSEGPPPAADASGLFGASVCGTSNTIWQTAGGNCGACWSPCVSIVKISCVVYCEDLV